MPIAVLTSAYKLRKAINYSRQFRRSYFKTIKSINLTEPSVQRYFNRLILENEILLMKDERNPFEIERLREIKSIVSILGQRMYLQKSIDSLKDEHIHEEDEDLKTMVQEELEIYRKRAKETDTQLQSILLEPFLSKSRILVEIVAAEGDGAMLFTKEIFHLYKAYGKYKTWSLDVASMEECRDGFKRASILIEGVGVREMMHFEKGVHHRISDADQVDRISTVSVSILIQPNESKIDDSSSELIIETKEASGAEGDTDCYVCVTHTPTGISVKCKANKSNKLNKYSAMKEINTLIFNNHAVSTEDEKDAGPIQSDKIIRTYDHSRDRVMEHREGADSQHQLTAFMEGGESLERVQESLLHHQHYETLMKEIAKFDIKQKIERNDEDSIRDSLGIS